MLVYLWPSPSLNTAEACGRLADKDDVLRLRKPNLLIIADKANANAS